MTNHATYAAGQTSIAHGTHNGKTLVLGWMISNAGHDDEEPLKEMRFATHSDGRVMQTDWETYGVSWFNKRGLKWVKADGVPAHAEFIGQYVDDMFDRAEAR